jgi:hypothetical protein
MAAALLEAHEGGGNAGAARIVQDAVTFTDDAQHWSIRDGEQRRATAIVALVEERERGEGTERRGSEARSTAPSTLGSATASVTK